MYGQPRRERCDGNDQHLAIRAAGQAGVRLNAKKKEVVDTDALLQRYKKEIDDLKARLAEREAEAAAPSRVAG